MSYKVHLIEFTGETDKPYKILHSADCGQPAHCYYDLAAGHSRLGLFPRPRGRYFCSIDWSDYLQVHDLVPDGDIQPTIEKPWTMGDLRAYVADRGHIPDDFEVTACVPERPRSWAHAGDLLYTNTLHGLQVDDPEDFE